MIGFNYIYKTPDEVLWSVSQLSSMWFTDMILLMIWVWWVLSCIFIFMPSLVIIIESYREKKEKNTKKKLLAQILLQKEIEDEVEREVDMESESSLR